MRPVNLLPEELRPRRASTARTGSSHLVLGVLGALLLATVVYVLTLNQIGSRERDLADAKHETSEADARAAKLKPVADFIKVKQQRELSVKTLAGSRFDWERLVLELSRVLPAGVYVTEVAASANGQAPPEGGSAGGSSSTPSTSSTSTGTAAGPTPPTMKLIGCAPSQDAVATTLVRMRRLHGAEDVKLSSSDDKTDSTAGGSATGAAAVTGGTEVQQEQCPAGRYTFEMSVVFDLPASAGGAQKAPSGKVPASLGGGS